MVARRGVRIRLVLVFAAGIRRRPRLRRGSAVRRYAGGGPGARNGRSTTTGTSVPSCRTIAFAAMVLTRKPGQANLRLDTA